MENVGAFAFPALVHDLFGQLLPLILFSLLRYRRGFVLRNAFVAVQELTSHFGEFFFKEFEVLAGDIDLSAVLVGKDQFIGLLLLYCFRFFFLHLFRLQSFFSLSNDLSQIFDHFVALVLLGIIKRVLTLGISQQRVNATFHQELARL